MPDSGKQTIVEYRRLNVLGRAVYLTGGLVSLATRVIDGAVVKAVDVVLAAERAFKEGRNPDIDEAKVLRETETDAC